MTDDIAKRLEKAEALAEMAEYYRQERDYAWERLERYREISRESDAVLLGKIDKLTAERDELRTRAASYENQMEFYRTAATLRFMSLESPKKIMEAVVQDLTSERDEARAEMARLENVLDEIRHQRDRYHAELKQERQEVERLRSQNWDMSHAITDAIEIQHNACADAYRRGAEAMREACAQRCCGTTDWFAAELRALPIPEEP